MKEISTFDLEVEAAIRSSSYDIVLVTLWLELSSPYLLECPVEVHPTNHSFFCEIWKSLLSLSLSLFVLRPFTLQRDLEDQGKELQMRVLRSQTMCDV